MKRVVILILFILIGTTLYINSLRNSFHYDDGHHILGNSYIRTVGNIPYFFTQPRSFSVRSTLHTHYRPLVMTSYAINHYFGGIDPRGYHLVNLGFHIGSAFMLFLILQAMLSSSRQTTGGTPTPETSSGQALSLPRYPIRGGGEKEVPPVYRLLSTVYFIPIAAGLIFLTTPYNTEVINYITARSTVMCAFFYLLAFYFWVRYREITPTLSLPRYPIMGGGKPVYCLLSTVYYLFSLLAFLLAMLTKEIAITLPVMLVLYDLYFVSKNAGERAWSDPEPVSGVSGIRMMEGTAPTYHQGERECVVSIPYQEERKPAFRLLSTVYCLLSTAYYYLPFAIVGGFIGVIFRIIFFRRFITERDMDLLTHFIIETKVIAKYFYHMTIPTNLSVQHSIKATTDIYLILSLILIIALLALVYLLWRSRDLPWQTGSFFITWFFIVLLPTSIIALNASYQENRGYLSAIGFAALLAVGVDKVRKRIAPSIMGGEICSPSPRGRGLRGGGGKQAILGYSLIGLLVVAYSIGVVQRNRVWLNDETLWSDVLKRYPESADAHRALGNYYISQKELEKAEAEFQTALRINPEDSNVLANLGVIYSIRGDMEKAEGFFRQALKINPFGDIINFYMAKFMYMSGDFQLASKHLLRMLIIRPDSLDAAVRLIDLYDRMGKLDKAFEQVIKAREDEPDNPAARRALGLIYMKRGQWREAAQEYEVVLKYIPKDPLTLVDSGIVYLRQGMMELAEERFRRALLRSPTNYTALQSLGILYQRQGRHDEALNMYKKALASNPKSHTILNNMALIYFEKKEYEKALSALQMALQIDPSYHMARVNLAKIYEGQGRIVLARKEYQRILKEMPSEGGDKEVYLKAKERLAALRQ